MKSILDLIENEDKKNPLTDEELSKMLGTTRSEVIRLRDSFNIGDSRERRKHILESEMKKILKNSPQISERELTKKLNDSGFNISRNIISRYIKSFREEFINSNQGIENVNTKHSMKESENEEEENNTINTAFSALIGSEGSLKSKVELAKASILYPPNGLHTLIYGNTGVGKSELAECMYKFAIESGAKEKNAPFIVFNCADYAENPQLLLSQLFGYIKGAYTGADANKEGLVEMANNGVLFLDEIHRLPPEGQEILFHLIDKGKFRRLGETQSTRTARIMIIAATTEDPESSLLITFRRRVPMLIELPPLKDRPFSERYEIITQFLSKEAFRINRRIIVKADVVRALMLYDCPGSIGQLRSDIQVACARSFLNSMKYNKKDVITKISDLPNHVRSGLLKISKREPEIDEFVNEDIVVNPDNSSDMIVKDDRYMLGDNIYQLIEERFVELEKEGLTRDQINKIVGNQVEGELKRFVKSVNSKGTISKRELQEIVGEKISEVVERAIVIGKQYFDDIQDNLYYSLATHINATYSRLINGKKIINPQLENIKTEYSKEYKVAKLMANLIGEELKVVLPEDEIGFIAMYLRTFCGKNQIKKGRVGVIVLSHGHVAMAMADVANRLLGVDHAVGIEMSLDESPQSALEKTIEVVKSIDEGKGCIILVDMGSLITFGEIITKKTGIVTMAVGRVDTVMVLDVLRRAIIENSNLKEIVDAVNCDKHYVGRIEGVKEINKLPKAIVTLCITGEGTALNIKKYIEDLIPEVKENIEVIPVGLMKQDNIEEEISRIREKNNILSIVGTFNPSIEDIPFISFEDVIKGYGLEKLKKILDIKSKAKSILTHVIKEELILIDVDATSKDGVIDKLTSVLYDKEYVNDKFMLSVYKREIMGNTCFKNNTAIPHGFPEHVNNSAIVIGKLSKPIEWEIGIEIDVVFLIALKDDSRDYFRSLNSLISNETVMNLIRESSNVSEIRNLILNNTR